MKKNLKLLLAGLAIAASLASAAPQRGSLKVGAARVDITPPANPEYPASGKYEHERLYVRAIVLDNGATRAAIIGADQSGVSEDVFLSASKQVAAELDCPVANVIMSATHSHSAIRSGPPAPGQARPPQQAVAPTVAAILDAVKQAKAKLQPAQVGFGTGASYLNVARDTVSEQTHKWTQSANLDAASDKTVAVVTFTAPSGEPIAAYVNYAMHPVNGYLVGITSADFPGAACRYVEQAFDDKMVTVFSQGASGDQNPLLMRPATNALASKSGVKITGYELVREEVEGPLREGKVPHGKLDPKVADRFERWIESEGMMLGEEVIRVMTNTKKRSGEVAIQGEQRSLTCAGRVRTNTGREGEPGTYQDGDPVVFRLGMLGIGDVALATVNAEIYTMISQRLKKQSPMANTVMVTLANGRANSGYVPNDASFGAYTFQVLGSRLKPGCAEQGIANTLTEMIGQYASK
ncbi:MAG: neutral/alkaline non-lysosomal ceramidase N-terminal domain-containing protein [Bryobacteraceae bacterium]